MMKVMLSLPQSRRQNALEGRHCRFSGADIPVSAA